MSYDYIERIFPVPTSNFDNYLATFNQNRSNFFKLELPLRIGCNIEHLDIKTVLKNSRGSGHAKGLDEISKELLKKLGDMGLEALNMIINGVLASGDYLEGFRDLKGFSKKGNIHNVDNFRPILITSFVATLTEKMSALQMINGPLNWGNFTLIKEGFCEIKV